MFRDSNRCRWVTRKWKLRHGQRVDVPLLWWLARRVLPVPRARATRRPLRAYVLLARYGASNRIVTPDGAASRRMVPKRRRRSIVYAIGWASRIFPSQL